MENNGIKIVVAIGLLAAAYGLYTWIGGGGPTVTLANGKSVSGGEVRSPIKAALVANEIGSEILFSIRLTDADGHAIRSVSLPGGGRPDARITIYNQAGQVVHSGTFRYG